jgi:hypothetical protein
LFGSEVAALLKKGLKDSFPLIGHAQSFTAEKV